MWAPAECAGRWQGGLCVMLCLRQPARPLVLHKNLQTWLLPSPWPPQSLLYVFGMRLDYSDALIGGSTQRLCSRRGPGRQRSEWQLSPCSCSSSSVPRLNIPVVPTSPPPTPSASPPHTRRRGRLPVLKPQRPGLVRLREELWRVNHVCCVCVRARELSLCVSVYRAARSLQECPFRCKPLDCGSSGAGANE